MPLPAGVETVTVSPGQPLTLPDGTLARGRITFTAPDLVTVASADFVTGGAVQLYITGGLFDDVTLVATDATGMSPTGWTYKVTVEFTEGGGWTRYISLPKNAPAVKLSDVLLTDPVEGQHAVLVDLAGVTAADVGADPAGAASTAMTTHVQAADPHGDRAYSDGVTGPIASRVTAVESGFTSVNAYITDALNRVQALENTRLTQAAGDARYLLLTGGTVNGAMQVVGLLSLGGGTTATTANAGTVVHAVLVSGDTFDRFRVYGDGKQEWGPGGNGARDTNLYRSAADVLRTDDTLHVTVNLRLNTTSMGGCVGASAWPTPRPRPPARRPAAGSSTRRAER
ncbi:hypothetical protein [Streptomyces sp. RTd22]|uniref:hypothetical protein n=1 Tax=Streptomyces sp. RTd22 TaxID=1841249 RepID=UPI0007D9B71A|nr:hypothetical protein [Streptomyces sp. RTd22]